MPKRVLFLSVANSGRSQMAEGLARHILGGPIEVVSAGTHPSTVDSRAISAMNEVGIDMSAHRAKHLNEIDAHSIDLVITLGSDPACPAVPSHVPRLHWSIADPVSNDGAPATEEVQIRFRTAREQIKARIEILKRLLDVPPGPTAREFHGSIRVRSLPDSVRFYAWLLDRWPKEWTHRYATFLRPDLRLNFVLLVSDGKDLHHDTLYHLGIEVADRAAVIDAYERARVLGCPVAKPPRTTWKGTPLHELWLEDPDGNLVEIYARLTDAELGGKPKDEAPVFLVPGTEPGI